MVIRVCGKTQITQKGLIPANGTSPNFLFSKKVLSDTNITKKVIILSDFEQKSLIRLNDFLPFSFVITLSYPIFAVFIPGSL